jgi:hypothetical protein
MTSIKNSAMEKTISISMASSWRAHNEEYYGSQDLTGAKGGHQGSRWSVEAQHSNTERCMFGCVWQEPQVVFGKGFK